jgi:hypothetical protein
MSHNSNFEKKIQEWVSLDNEIKELNDRMKFIKDQKNIVSKHILNYVEENNMNNSNIKIGDEKIKFVRINTCQSVTFKYLEQCLREIIKNDEQVKKIIGYIKQRREVKQQIEIKRFNNN